MTKFHLLSAACVAALLSGSSALAEGAAPDLAPVIITANRSATPQDEVSAAVSVLDAATLQTRQTVNVAEALARSPGVTLVRNGGLGQTTTLSLRGAPSEQTVVIVDGVRVNDPAAPGGGYDFSNLFAGDISRIEVLRGPSSTLWGADAIGGVVNIISAAPTAGLSANGSVEAGSNDTRYLRAAVSGVADRLSFRLSGGYVQTSGVSAFDARLGGKEPDGALNASASARIGYELSGGLSLDARYALVNTKTAFDGYPPPNYNFADTPDYGESRQSTGYLGLNFKGDTLAGLGGAVKSQLSVQALRLDRDSFDPTSTPSRTFYARGGSQKLAWQGEWTLAPRVVTVAGVESERTTIRSAAPSSFDPNPAPLRAHARLDSAFASGRATVVTGLTLSGGLRLDHHDRFGDHMTASAGLAYTPDAGITQLRASFGQGFKAPTLYQLYGDYGFTGLKPETAEGFDAGLSRRWFDGRLEAGVSLYSRDARQQIGFFDCFAGTAPQCATRPFGFYANIARARTQGVELEGAIKPNDHLTFSANYSFTDAVNRAPGANFGKTAPQRPRDMANAEAVWSFAGGANLSLAARYAGESFVNLANTRRLKGYSLVDIRGEFPLAGGVTVDGRVENLFDRPWQTAYQYGSTGRAGYVGLRVHY